MVDRTDLRVVRTCFRSLLLSKYDAEQRGQRQDEGNCAIRPRGRDGISFQTIQSCRDRFRYSNGDTRSSRRVRDPKPVRADRLPHWRFFLRSLRIYRNENGDQRVGQNNARRVGKPKQRTTDRIPLWSGYGTRGRWTWSSRHLRLVYPSR